MRALSPPGENSHYMYIHTVSRGHLVNGHSFCVIFIIILRIIVNQCFLAFLLP